MSDVRMTPNGPARRPLFPLGRVVATPGALDALQRSGESAAPYLTRHVTGDWGNLCEDDRAANEEALRVGARLLSSYCTLLGDVLWVISEAGRSSSCLLTPAEY